MEYINNGFGGDSDRSGGGDDNAAFAVARPRFASSNHALAFWYPLPPLACNGCI